MTVGNSAAGSSRPILSRLRPMDPREIWRHEARDFTPWLLENADILGEELGMDLVLEVAEHPVGGFLLDLIGVDEATNERVIVENQLTPTDHIHLVSWSGDFWAVVAYAVDDLVGGFPPGEGPGVVVPDLDPVVQSWSIVQNTPRCRQRRCSSANQRSTWLIQEE